jgi:hypothetical protein
MQGKQLSQVLDKDPALMECRTQIAKRLELFVLRLMLWHG